MGFDTPDFSTAEIPKHSGIYQCKFKVLLIIYNNLVFF